MCDCQGENKKREDISISPFPAEEPPTAEPTNQSSNAIGDVLRAFNGGKSTLTTLPLKKLLFFVLFVLFFEEYRKLFLKLFLF